MPHADPTPNADSNTVRARIEGIRAKAAQFVAQMENVPPVLKVDAVASAIAVSLVPSLLLIQQLCDALLAERDAETAPEQTASEAWSEIARAGSGEVGKEGYADGNSGRAGRSEPAMTAKAHRAPATVPPNGEADTAPDVAAPNRIERWAFVGHDGNVQIREDEADARARADYNDGYHVRMVEIRENEEIVSGGQVPYVFARREAALRAELEDVRAERDEANTALAELAALQTATTTPET